MSETQRNNSFVYAFDKIRTPKANEDDLKAFTRKVNAAFEDLYAKIYGYIGMENLSKSAQAAINSKVESKDLANYSTIEQTETMISREVGTLSGDISRVEQTANKVVWLVQSGTSASNMTLTDRLFELVAADMNLNGRLSVLVPSANMRFDDDGLKIIQTPTGHYALLSPAQMGFFNASGELLSGIDSAGKFICKELRDSSLNLNSYFKLQSYQMQMGTAGTGAALALTGYQTVSGNDVALGGLSARYWSGTAGAEASVCVACSDGASITLSKRTQANGDVDPTVVANGHLWPDPNSTYYLGASDNRWGGVFLKNNPNVSSDARLKRDIADMDGGLIDHLRPRTFRMKADPQRRRFGFIAQEVRDALHGMGIYDAALVDDENPESLGLCYEQIIAPLVARVQAQQRQIDDLEARIARLEAKA